jgi:hypothetical protein
VPFLLDPEAKSFILAGEASMQRQYRMHAGAVQVRRGSGVACAVKP